MPATVPTSDEFNALLNRVTDLEDRVFDLEQTEPEPPDPIDPGPDPGPDPEPPPPGTLQCVITIPDNYTRRGVVQQAAGTYVFNEDDGINLQPWHDPFGNRFTMSRAATRVAGCQLRVYFCRLSGDKPWQSVEIELGDWRGTGLNVNDRNGIPLVFNLNRYSVEISDADGVLATYDLTTNGCKSLGNPDAEGNRDPPCAHGWNSGWRWVSGLWPYKNTVASLTDAGLLPAMSADAVPNGPGAGPGPFTYPPVNPNHLLGMNYGPGMSGTDDSIAGMMQGLHGRYCQTETADDFATMMAVADSGHNYPMMVRDLDTEALADFWTSSYNPGVYGNAMPRYWTIMDVRLDNASSSDISIPNGNGSPQQTYVADSDGQVYLVGNDQSPPNNPPIVVPAGGTAYATFLLYYAHEPTGTPSLYTDDGSGNRITYPGLSVSYQTDSLSRGSGTGNDSSHNPPFAFVPYLVTGDPYHLAGLHGLAVNAGFCGISNSRPPFPEDGSRYLANGRGTSWTLRDVMHAEQATPADAPSWVIAKSSFRQTVDAILQGLQYVSQHPAAPAWAHTTYNMHAVNDESWWQEDYIHQAVAWCAMVYPGTGWEALLDWQMVNPISRLNDTSGWCGSWPVYYKQAYGASPGGLYTSWAEMFAGELVQSPQQGRGNLTPCVPGELTKNCSPDYVGGLYAALALAIQSTAKRTAAPAWLADATICRSSVVEAVRAANAADAQWGFSCKHGYA